MTHLEFWTDAGGNWLSLEIEAMSKKSSGKLSERELARRREQAKAQDQDSASNSFKQQGKAGGKPPPPTAKQFRHQGR
jgi:hypothetical protein